MLYKLFLFFWFSVSQYRLSKTVSFHLGYCHAPYFGVDVGGRVKADGENKKPGSRFYRVTVTNGRDRKEHLQSREAVSQSVVGAFTPLSPHRNHTELLFRQCATRLSVAVLDIAFQVT